MKETPLRFFHGFFSALISRLLRIFHYFRLPALILFRSGGRGYFSISLPGLPIRISFIARTIPIQHLLLELLTNSKLIFATFHPFSQITTHLVVIGDIRVNSSFQAESSKSFISTSKLCRFIAQSKPIE